MSHEAYAIVIIHRRAGLAARSPLGWNVKKELADLCADEREAPGLRDLHEVPLNGERSRCALRLRGLSTDDLGRDLCLHLR